MCIVKWADRQTKTETEREEDEGALSRRIGALQISVIITVIIIIVVIIIKAKKEGDVSYVLG